LTRDRLSRIGFTLFQGVRPLSSNKEIVQEFNQAYDNAIQHWGQWMLEARTDMKYFVGNQWSSSDRQFAQNTRRELKTINKVRRVIKLVEGFQRKHRLAMKADPIALAMNQLSELEAKTASQMSAVLQFEMSKRYGGYLTMSQAFSGALKVGLNLVEIYVDYKDDLISGDLRFARKAHNEFVIDPSTTKLSLEDCGYIIERKFLSPGACKQLLPDRANEIDKLRPKGFNDGKFIYAPRVRGIDGKDLLRYDTFYRWDTKQRKVVVDRQTGDHFVWRGTRRQLAEWMQSIDPKTNLPMSELMTVISRPIPTMRQIVLVEEELMYDGPDILGIDDYPFVPVWAYFDPEHDKHEEKLQGLIRAMRDPQVIVNQRYSKLEDILDKLAYGGLKLTEDALVNPEQAYQVGHGLPLWIRAGKDPSSVQDRQMPQIPQGLFAVLELADKMLLDSGMVTDELLGDPSSPQTEVAGVLSKLRQAAGLTVLQDIFDNYRESKRMLGYKLIAAIQKHYQPSKIAQIINEEPTPSFFDKTFPRMNVNITEGVLSDSQREMYHFQLLQYKAQGAPIPWSEIIDTAPLEGKNRLKEVVAREEQANAEMAKAQLEAQQVVQYLTMAEAQARISSAKLNDQKVETEIAQALLDRVKAIGEMEKIKAEISGLDAKRIAEILKALSTFHSATKPDQRRRGITKR